ncbi:hypothetical protein jhhlp_001210 [Lomentospora prolificans]|uniref:Uncharacterized protein n=1 Tax=Lomentospora prolificans TaxID=41688 RepID=A0A2N3NHK2_9PEZI|nr:hypothetical protein jhhlp_001210 [Lomentospora prolificans]
MSPLIIDLARVVLGILANLSIIVPLRILARNGEFAAVIFISATFLLNCFTVANALIWRSDDTAPWWHGEGYCDIFPYVHYPLLMVYATSAFAIMRHLAQQISLTRADSPSPKEVRRRNLMQALIIFPFPLVQLAWIYPLTAHRYSIMTLSGCIWMPDSSWPLIVFFIMAHPLCAFGAVYHAIVIYLRYKQIAATTTSILTTSNSVASNRARRARRRLYRMTTSIIVPYFPVAVLFGVNSIIHFGPFSAYDFSALRDGTRDGRPWNAIMLLPTSAIDVVALVDRYIAIVTAIPIFIFFGMTKDAMNMYRMGLLAVGLGRFFPRLEEEYDPDRKHLEDLSATGILALSETSQSFTKSLGGSGSQSPATSTRQYIPPLPKAFNPFFVARSMFRRKESGTLLCVSRNPSGTGSSERDVCAGPTA